VSLASLDASGFATGNFNTAARVVTELVQRYQENPWREATLLNVNVPDVPWEALQGTEATRLGRRHKAEPVLKSVNPRGQTVYWVGAAGTAQDAGDGTDFHAVANRRVSITPLQIDLTRYTQLDGIRTWLA
jgi:5'-nucleotidase